MPITQTNHDKDLAKALKALARAQVLVGIPASKNTQRQGGINNATIGLMNEEGTVSKRGNVHIPARGWLSIGLASGQADYDPILRKTASDVLEKPSLYRGIIKKGLRQAGQAAVDAIKLSVTQGLEPPLALATLKAREQVPGSPRLRSKKVRAKIEAEIALRNERFVSAGESGFKPLINSGNFLNSISYVVRTR